jgi:hypothetical protein
MITSIKVEEQGDTFTVASGECLHVWKICRDLNFIELSGHGDALLSIVSVRSSSVASSSSSSSSHPDDIDGEGQQAGDGGGGASSSSSSHSSVEHKMFSASLDNTIRCWDL